MNNLSNGCDEELLVLDLELGFDDSINMILATFSLTFDFLNLLYLHLVK